MSKKSRALAKRTPLAIAAIPAPTASPEVGRLVLPRPSSSRAGRSIQQVTPSRVGSVLRDLDGGRYEQWADLIQQASRDPIVHRVDYIRRAAVAARPYTVRTPDDVAPGMQALAEEAVRLTKTWLASIPARAMWLMRVLGAINAGIAVDELVYYRSQGLTLSRPEPVYTRDVRLNPIDDAVEVRSASLEWIRVADHPGKFLVHVPYTRPGRAQDQGEFQAGVWYWCFKNKAIMFWLLGAERFANPLVIAKMMADSSKNQREAMLADLQQLTSDSVGVLVGATDVQTLTANATGASQVWETLTKKFDDQIALAGGVSPDLLMSGVNGSRASDTLRDGVRCEGSKLDSVLMWGSVVRDCVAPLLVYNLRRNDVPLPIIESVFDDAVAVRPETIATGKVRVNEARAGNGLPALSDEDGGNGFVPTPTLAPAGLPGTAYDPNAAPDGVKVADAALNGAQGMMLSAVIKDVAAGLMPRDSAIAQLMLMFQVTSARATELLGSAGAGFVPANPATGAPAVVPPPADAPPSPITPGIQPDPMSAEPAPGSAPAASPFPTSPLSAGGMPTL